MFEAYLSGQVVRYHANPVMARLGQTTAEHQWGCAILIERLHPNPSLNLILAALKHDGGELLAGDVPYPFKVANPEAAAAHAAVEQELAKSIGMECPDLTEEETKWLTMVDRLECQLYAKIHAPHQLAIEGWKAQTQLILNLAAELGCELQVQQMIGGS